ncbi:MAG: glycosyl transferase family protein [Aliivibrio sp.]|uniref:glycosyl transferase family protein n=1 Tax=Aliivibrio sp. TaxID=1872443 RepID=UPI001A39331A|nr:glycosyl transferase family protein [Aliivibrio sp.]
MSSIIECIRTVGRGERSRKPLSYQQAHLVMTEYLQGQVPTGKMAMLMMLIRVQNETAAEVAGFTLALREYLESSSPTLNQLKADVDWPCFAGKRELQGAPWHLYSAKALAMNGKSVLIHGHIEAGTKRLHAANFLDTLGITYCNSIEQAQQELEKNRIAYLPLDVYAPQVVDMLRWQQEYGLRTPINTCARMLNPSNAKISLRGSFHPGFPKLHAEAEYLIQQQIHNGKPDICTVSFKGVGGESEFNPKVSQSLFCATRNGVEELYWDEKLNPDLPQLVQCVMGTDTDKLELLANTAVAGIAVVLWAAGQSSQMSRDQAINGAERVWQDYVNHAI